MSHPVERPADLTPFQRTYLRNLRSLFDSPPTTGRLIARSWRAYVLFFAYFGFVFWLFWELNNPGAMWFMLGMAAGAVVRDLGLFRRSVQLWPVTQVIVDRRRVEELLGEGHDDPNTKS